MRPGCQLTLQSMAQACAKADLIAPLTMFKALRMQMDELGLGPDHTINGLSGLAEVASLA